jgi:hypothetical protein
MKLKMFFAAFLAALTLSLFAGAPAEAKTRVYVGIGAPVWGPGYHCWGYPRRCGYRPGYRYVAPRPVYIPPRPVVVAPVVVRGRISCATARNIVDRRGYNAVVARNCSGSVYSFKARRNGLVYRVDVNARNGHIIGTRRF